MRHRIHFSPSSFAILTFFGFSLLLGCAQQDEKKFADRAEAEGRGANKAGQELLEEKAREMEADLSNRQQFYGAIEGQYLGTTKVGNQNFNIKFTIARSIPPYFGSRVRQLSEIEADLNNLAFNIQVVQWHPDDVSTAVGCRVNQIRPDMQSGEMVISSPDCSNLYMVLLSDDSTELGRPPHESAKGAADKLRNRQIATIDSLVGTIEPTSNANTFSFSVKKVTP